MGKEIKFTTSKTAFVTLGHRVITDPVPENAYEILSIECYLHEPSLYLGKAIRVMKPGDPLHKLLKEELTALHHWKALPRGNPKAGFKKSREGK